MKLVYNVNEHLHFLFVKKKKATELKMAAEM